MTDYAEEQSSELETLRCIYTPDELVEVSETPPTFQITMTTTADSADSTEDALLSVTVQFSYPATYPDVPVETEIVDQSGLSDEQLKEVETLLRDEATANVGMVMVYTLVSGVQERLVEVVERVRVGREEEERRRKEEELRLEEAKFRGTIVTKQSFLEWRTQFDEEMLRAGGRKVVKETSSAQKLTGRQMFEIDASLALSDAKFLSEDGEGGEGGVAVDESLFQDLGDLELAEDA